MLWVSSFEKKIICLYLNLNLHFSQSWQIPIGTFEKYDSEDITKEKITGFVLIIFFWLWAQQSGLCLLQVSFYEKQNSVGISAFKKTLQASHVILKIQLYEINKRP